MTRASEYWDKKHVSFALEEWIEKPSIFATQVISFFPAGGSVLDLGAGQGQDSIYFVQNGHSVTVTDISTKALDLAKKRTTPDMAEKMEFQVVDLSQPLPYSPESYDVVYSHDALHFFDTATTTRLFDEVYNILKPGGIFAVLVNTTEDPTYGQGSQIEEHYFSTLEGISKHFFTVESMKGFTKKFQTILLDAKGEAYKYSHKSLIRFVGKK